jgi:hypothetical protein
MKEKIAEAICPSAGQSLAQIDAAMKGVNHE